MSRLAVGVVVSTVIAGNVLMCFLVLGLRESSRSGGLGSAADGDATALLPETIDSLRQEVERLAAVVASRTSPSTLQTDAAAAAGGDLAARFDDVIQRLEALEKAVAANHQAGDELTALGLREKLEAQFRAADGYVIAEELLAQEKFAVGANGILTFLDAHPDHPDEQDLMRRARDGFRQSGYLDKALWLQSEIMKKFPEHRGGDLTLIARLETRMRRYDDALRHIEESVQLATTDQNRMQRRFYRAEIVHQRDGDIAGLEAYREVERLARAAGIGPADEAAERAERIEKRLSSR